MITKIKYNWRQVSYGHDAGEDYDEREIGKNGVTNIHEHLPRGDADPHYCRVDFEDGHQERIMNLNAVISDTDGI